MLADLRQFYSAKYAAFCTCRQACLSVCDIIHQLYDDIVPSVSTVYACIEALTDSAKEATISHAAILHGDLHYQVQHAHQELDSIDDIIGASFQKHVPELSLNGFIDISSALQVPFPFRRSQLHSMSTHLNATSIRSHYSVKAGHNSANIQHKSEDHPRRCFPKDLQGTTNRHNQMDSSKMFPDLHFRSQLHPLLQWTERHDSP